MRTRGRGRASFIATCWVAAVLVALPAPPVAQAETARPLSAADFVPHAPRGFGDAGNTWAQSMVWWKDHLYVGTGRVALCSALFAIWSFVGILAGREFADTWLPYPPRDPDLFCTADGADLALQAEIWRWAPETDTWLRVFQSPNDLDNPGTGPPDPPRIGKKLPYDVTIRGMTPHVEPDGTEALYAFGVNSTTSWDRNHLPPPRILRSTDGLTFTPLPQTVGTFLGDLPFNPDHSSFRSPASFGGKLFVLSGPVFGQGSLIASADPARGDDAWFLAAPAEVVFYEMAVFNGWLYLGTFDPFGSGYSVLKTRAEGPPPYTFVTVVPPGAFVSDRASRSVVSMHVWGGRLYVGTATYTEIIRINRDDTWDVVIGSPRAVPTADGGTEWKYPLSGLDVGFGHTLNDHAWQMEAFGDRLYIGTYNACTATKDDPVNGPLLAHIMGAHLYQTHDGWYYSAITTNGFKNASDPSGGLFDFGVRTMSTTPYGLFLGTTNDHRGLQIFRATGPDSTAPEAPPRLEIEPVLSGGALLSWRPTDCDDTYQVWRAEIHGILVRDDVNIEMWNGITGNKIPDRYIGPYEQVGTTEEPAFIDSTVQVGQRYMYYVTRVHGGQTSEASNLVAFPLLNPPQTFSRILAHIDRISARPLGRGRGRRLRALRRQVVEAQGQANRCQIRQAIDTLTALNPIHVGNGQSVDLEILISKLVRRLALFDRFPRDVYSDEFCGKLLPARKLLPGRKLEQCASE